MSPVLNENNVIYNVKHTYFPHPDLVILLTLTLFNHFLFFFREVLGPRGSSSGTALKVRPKSKFDRTGTNTTAR